MDLDELRRAGITPAPEVPGYPHHVVGFGDLDEDLPPIASQLLADLLPGYAEARGKWPLWTYERRHRREVPFHRFRKAATWHGTRSWADRLAFSPVQHLGAVENGLDSRGKPFGLALVEWFPGNSLAYLEPTKELYQAHEDSPTLEFFCRLTSLERLTVAAICAQTSSEVPGSIDEIHLGDQGDRLGLSEDDYRDLVERMERDLSSTAVVPQLISHQWQTKKTEKKHRGPESRTLIADFFRRIGLLPDRRGGLSTALADDALIELYDEALGIVEAIRSWKLEPEMLDLMVELIDEDPYMQLDHMDKARLKRGTIPPGLEVSAMNLRFPFLLQSEIKQLRKRLAQDVTEKAAARYLVMSRLPGFDPQGDDDSFQVRLSKARRIPEPDSL